MAGNMLKNVENEVQDLFLLGWVRTCFSVHIGLQRSLTTDIDSQVYFTRPDLVQCPEPEAISTAMTLWESAAAQGLAKAQATIGHIYLYGIGTWPRDQANAVKYLEAASAQGDLASMYSLGKIHMAAGNKAKAESCWSAAATQGCPEAQCCLAEVYLAEGRQAAAERVLLQEALQGNDTAEARWRDIGCTEPEGSQEPEGSKQLRALVQARLPPRRTTGHSTQQGEDQWLLGSVPLP